MNLLCSGPGPHQPTSGILGEGDRAVAGLLCAACAAAVDQAVQAEAAQSEADAAKVANAQQDIANLHGNVPAWQTQLQADLNAVQTGWQTLTAAQQTAILLRILNGLGDAMTGMLDHATVTGALPPS